MANRIRVIRRRKRQAKPDDSSITKLASDQAIASALVTPGSDAGTTSEHGEDDGKVKIIGVTQAGRDAGVLHDHPFVIKGKVGDDGTLEFEGDTGEASEGRTHSHAITAIVADPSQTHYDIETEEASDGDGHKHVISIDLKEALGPQDDESEESDEETKMSRQPGFPWIRKMAAAPQTGFGGLMYTDGAAHMAFRRVDERRTFDGDMMFVAPLDDLESIVANGRPKVTLTPEGLLRIEVSRTGVFVHPKYGKVAYTKERFDRTIDHFNAGVLRQMVPFNEVHEYKKGSLGWVANVLTEPKVVEYIDRDNQKYEADGHVLVAHAKLTPKGEKKIVRNGEYAYASAEYAENFRQPELFVLPGDKKATLDKAAAKLGRITHNGVLVGVAAVNNPYISGLAAYAAAGPSTAEVQLYQAVMRDFKHNVPAAHDAFYEEARRRGLL